MPSKKTGLSQNDLADLLIAAKGQKTTAEIYKESVAGKYTLAENSFGSKVSNLVSDMKILGSTYKYGADEKTRSKAKPQTGAELMQAGTFKNESEIREAIGDTLEVVEETFPVPAPKGNRGGAGQNGKVELLNRIMAK